MSIILNYLRGKYKVINYCIFYILLGLTSLEFGFDFLVFIFSIISLTFNKDLNQVLVYYASIVVFNITTTATVSLYFLIYMNIILLTHFIIRVIKKELKINYWVLALFLFYALYMFLDFNLKNTSVYAYLKYTCLVSALILVYRLKDSFNFKVLTLFFTFALIYNFAISLFFTDKLYLYDAIDDVYRYIGIQEHPNIFAHRCVFALSCLMALKYHEKISDSVFLTLFAILYFMGLTTISRIFLIGIVADCVVFAIFYLYKNKRDGFVLLIIMVAILCIISLLSSYEMNSFLSRFVNRDESLVPEIAEEDYEKVLNGEIHYDYGRLSVWTLYIKKLLSEPLRIIFGYGYTVPLPGSQHPHNNILAYIYYNGVFGLIILGLIIFALIDKSKLKDFKKYLPLSLVLCGFYVLAFLNDNTMFGFPFIMIAVYCNCKLCYKNSEEQKEYNREYFECFNKIKRI